MPDPNSWPPEGRPPTSGAASALRDLVDAALVLRHVVSRRTGLSESELAALDHLSRSPLGPAEVARRLEVSSAAATGIVDRLADRGHAERSPHPQDRRRVEVHLTDSGRRELFAQLLPMIEGLASVDAGFDDAELAVVERYLRGAIAALKAVTDG